MGKIISSYAGILTVSVCVTVTTDTHVPGGSIAPATSSDRTGIEAGLAGHDDGAFERLARVLAGASSRSDELSSRSAATPSGRSEANPVSRYAHTAVVGQPGQARAQVLQRRPGHEYVLTATLAPSVELSGFGSAVSVWGSTAVVGAPGQGSGLAGAIIIFERGEEGWFEELILQPEQGAPGDGFGSAVAIAGDTVIAGAPGADGGAGAAYVFHRTVHGWVEGARLAAPTGHGDAGFGSAVAVQRDRAVVSVFGVAGQPGAAYRFRRQGMTWAAMERIENIANIATIANIETTADIETIAGIETIASTTNLAPTPAQLTCPDADTLGALASCIHDQMPIEGSNGYVVPTGSEQTDWRAVVADMLHGHCAFALPPSLAGAMQLGEFIDLENNKTYCVLMETTDADNDGYVDKGWGTFIVDPVAIRELSQQAPHPYNDYRTAIQAANVFKGTGSRTYLMCGSHRRASSVMSACDSEYHQSDCAHSKDNMYYPTVLELASYYGSTEYTQIQWHGMAETTCPHLNIYISPGLSSTPPPESNVHTLMANVQHHHPTWAVDVPGDGTCPLNGTGNTEGRFLNGVTDSEVCARSADAATNKFVHVEQERDFRYASEWIAPVSDTWPAAGSELTAPDGVSATGSRRRITLSWNSVTGAARYQVRRSAISGGPYTMVGTVTSTEYRDQDLADGTTYYYVITAADDAGHTATSIEVSATTR